MISQNEIHLRRYQPAMDLTAAASGLPPASLVMDESAVVDPLAHLYVAKEGGGIRTLIGAAHKHWYSLFPSMRSGLWQPVESEGEEMLAQDGDCEFDVLDSQAQGGRLRIAFDDGFREWIIDHLRMLRDGTVEAIEVKPHPGALDADTKLKVIEAARVLGRLGWKVRVRYHEEIRGSAARQINRAAITGDSDVTPCGDAIEAFDHLMAAGPSITLRRLWDELPGGRFQREAVARAFMASGRVDYDMDEHLHGGSRIVLHPAPSFNSRIRFHAR